MDPDAKEQQLTELKAQALKAYSLKDYAASSDFYAQACELQSSIRGDDDPRNAYLLYLYGRSLFQIALKKSDVLGGAPLPEDGKGAEDQVKPVTEPPKKPEEPAKVVPAAKPGFFSFTGDENWDDSDGEDAGEDEKEAEGEQGGEDDFTLAWEILDFARVLFLKQLSPPAPETKSGTEEPALSATTANSSTEPTTSIPKEEASKESAAATTSLTEEEAKTVKTALADTYDILGEVSLESESFAQAAKDLRSSLDAKLELYPLESTLISEAHFKLSLALEFAAAGEDVSEDDQKKGREDAAVEMERAIASCKARIAKEEAELGVDKGSKGKGKEMTTKSLEEAREMVAELEIRVRTTYHSRSSPIYLTIYGSLRI